MDKCLAFCQALVKSDQKFTLNLTIGKDKLFFSNKGLASSWKRKKKSSSQFRREENRKIKPQNKATEKVAGDGANEETEDNSTAEKAEVPAAIVCEECVYTATTEKGLKQHRRMKHGKAQQSTLSTPEAPRRPSKHRDLSPNSSGRRPATTVRGSSPQNISAMSLKVTLRVKKSLKIKTVWLKL